jgi:hypothetical protein
MSPHVKNTRFQEPSSSASSNSKEDIAEYKHADTSVMLSDSDHTVKKRKGSAGVPAVFSRLWDQNKKRDEKLRLQRNASREKQDADWRIKLAGVNQLQKTFQGMTVY